MKKPVYILVFIFMSIQVLSQQYEPGFTDKMALSEKAGFLKKYAFTESENYGLTDFIYQRMEWEIDPDVLFIKGVITTYFKSNTQNLNEIEFDLQSNMIVDSIIQNNQKLEYQKSQDKLVIALPEILHENQIDSLSIYYNGVPKNSGFGAFSQTMHNNIPNIWTLSEPYGAMEWWPCKQSLVDKIDSIDIIVSSPESYRTASNGILISETVDNQIRKMHWKHRFPIATYLIAVSVTNYEVYPNFLELDNGRKIEIVNYIYPEMLESAKTKTPVTAEIMALFNELVGEYPFATEKYGHAQFGWGGGMEHQTISFMNNFEFGLVSHELAHQWFGDYITLGSWQDIWLNEGFATYLTGLSYEHLLNEIWWPVWKKDRVARITSESDGSVFVNDTTDIGRLFSSRLSYSKGAYLLHMLRWILGDENFYSGLRNYFSDQDVANGFARTYQFVNHMEAASDTSLTEFFNDWFYGEGFPVYSAQYWQTESNELTVLLSQNPTHQSVDFFEMPVPIRVYNSDKSDSADFRLVNSNNNQYFVLDPGFRISELKIDPEFWLVSKTSQILNEPIEFEPGLINVYPNPFTDLINIYLPNNEKMEELRIFDLNGKLIQALKGDNTSINIPGLKDGEYLLKITTSKRDFSKKVVKF
jgi:aminopeptidase N